MSDEARKGTGWRRTLNLVLPRLRRRRLSGRESVSQPSLEQAKLYTRNKSRGEARMGCGEWGDGSPFW
jgi:hypothetical protein